MYNKILHLSKLLEEDDSCKGVKHCLTKGLKFKESKSVSKALLASTSKEFKIFSGISSCRT